MDPGSALRISEDRNHITTRSTHFGKKSIFSDLSIDVSRNEVSCLKAMSKGHFSGKSL